MPQELYALEDLVADFVEQTASVAGGSEIVTKQMIHFSGEVSAASRLHKLVSLSVAIGSDAALARQLRRKFA